MAQTSSQPSAARAARRVAVVAALLLAGLLLAGCSTPRQGHDPTSSDDSFAAVGADGVLFECPPGDSQTTREGICVGSLVLPTSSAQEPYIVVDPWRPNVIAVGVNSGQTAFATSPTRPTPGVEPLSMHYFFTEDSGATWRSVPNPFIPIPGSPAFEVAALGDPAMVFDETGRMHVSGMKTPSVPDDGWEIFYASTPDLGRTWTTPVVFTADGNNDRNWIGYGGAGRVYVNWQSGGDSDMVWSTDWGATWTAVPAENNAKDCGAASEPVFFGGSALFACSKGGAGTGLYRLDENANTLVNVTVIPDLRGTFPRFVIGPTGTWHVAATGDDPDITYATSVDSGATWSPPVDALAVTAIDDTWIPGGTRIWWFDADPWGLLHFIIAGQISGSSVEDDVPLNIPVAHFALAAGSNALAAESLIGHRLFYNEPTRIPPAVGAPGVGDHYYGMDFRTDQGYMVWTREQAIDFTVVKPVFAATAPGATTASRAGPDAVSATPA